MKTLNQNTKYFLYGLVIVFSAFSIAYMAFANSTLTSVLEGEKNILIEEQLEIQENTSKLKSKLSKYSEELDRLQGLVNTLKSQIQDNKDYHNINTGKIEQITRTLDLYEGLQ